MKVLLLEDDIMLSEIISEYLDSLGYEATTVYDGEEAEDFVYSQKFDLLLLDVNVPKLNGFDFLKSFRTTGNKTPAIFITSLHNSDDLVEGFDAGCDDYIKKPFDLIELKSRIDNIKRHFHIDEEKVYKISQNINYDTIRKSLYVDNKPHMLPKREAEILEYLITHKERTVSSNELIDNLWSYEDAPVEATIRTYIKNLRKLLPKDMITTIKGVGYRFNS
jgi:DNA-binding response OmpR family regulator